MPFASPVLAERAHVAQNALKASLRRRTAEAAAPRTLGEAAELYFSEHSLHDEDVEWDAWRRPDGRWALVASYAADGRPRRAEFTHDQPGRYVVAENDDARLLTGELRAPDEPAPARPQSSRRLSSVPHQDELPLGDDAIELTRNSPERPDEAPAPQTADPIADPIADSADADWLAAPVEPTSEDVPLIDEPAAEEPAEPVAEVEPDETETPVEEPTEEDTVEVKQSSRRKGRSSVPSWDEIMFGGSAKDD
jgi:hypothetical protein